MPVEHGAIHYMPTDCIAALRAEMKQQRVRNAMELLTAIGILALIVIVCELGRWLLNIHEK